MTIPAISVPAGIKGTTIKPTIDNDIDNIISFGGRRESWCLQKDCKHGGKAQKKYRYQSVSSLPVPVEKVLPAHPKQYLYQYM